jgi:hypothetical protein
MRKKIIILSTAVAVLIILSGLSSTICAKDVELSTSNEKLMVEVNRYYSGIPEPIYTEITYEEAEEIKELLINLNEAMNNNDEETISYYESVLNEKGIFGNKYQEFYSNDEFNEMMKKSQLNRLMNYFPKANGDNISNSLCYFHAVGTGYMYFTLAVNMIESITRIVENASSPLAGLILLLALLPFLVLILLFTSLIPFRILMPAGILVMRQGKISSLGLGGYKNLEVVEPNTINVNVSYFTGVTLSLPIGENPFVFISGIAADVRETDT